MGCRPVHDVTTVHVRLDLRSSDAETVSPQLRRFLACAILTPAVFLGSLYLQPDWLASVGCILALFLGLPLAIVLYLEYVRARAAGSPVPTLPTRALAAPIALLGFASLAIGIGIVGWVLFNVLIERQPAYTGDARLPSLGLGPLLILFGWRQLRRPLSR